MNYSLENFERALAELKETNPHNLDALRSLYESAKKCGYKSYVAIPLETILESEIWSTKEKVELIELYEYQKFIDGIISESLMNCNPIGGYFSSSKMGAVDYSIIKGSITGMEAAIIVGGNISQCSVANLSLVANKSVRYKMAELLIQYFVNKEGIRPLDVSGDLFQVFRKFPKNLCDSYNISGNRELAPMKFIIETGDVDLVNLWLSFVQNPSRLLRYAIVYDIMHGNTIMTDLLLEYGADVNYQEKEYKKDGNKVYETPLKIAIDYNSLDMVDFLCKHGADVNYVCDDPNVQNVAREKGSLDILLHNKMDDDSSHKYLKLTYASLPYAINVGPGSVLQLTLLSEQWKTQPAEQQAELDKRKTIVNYLFQNGAKFNDGTIDYSEMIKYFVVCKDADQVRYYFEEAKKCHAVLDFFAIVSAVQFFPLITSKSYSRNRIDTYISDYEPIYRICIEYVKEIAPEMYNKIAIHIISSIASLDMSSDRYNQYFKSFVLELYAGLDADEKKLIPLVDGMPLLSLNQVFEDGINVNDIDERGYTILMTKIIYGESLEKIKALVSSGVDVNYIDSNTGESALSVAIKRLPGLEASKIVFYLINKSNAEVIQSDGVLAEVMDTIGVGDSQVNNFDVLKALITRGFVVTDQYYIDSIRIFGPCNSDYPRNKQFKVEKLLSNPDFNVHKYLQKLYSILPNRLAGCNLLMPDVSLEKTKAKKQKKDLFSLLCEHLERNYYTKPEQILNPDETSKKAYEYDEFYGPKTNLELARYLILREIRRFMEYLNPEDLLAIIDKYPIIDISMAWKSDVPYLRSNLLTYAQDRKLSWLYEELIKRGATIVTYDKDGHDITGKLFSQSHVLYYTTYYPDYDPDSEYRELLRKIGIESNDRAMQVKPVEEPK